MGVTLERVQFKFASIIGELCSEPDILSQFAVWVDLRLAEYKFKGSISLDCSGDSPDPIWLKGIKSAILEKALAMRAAANVRPMTKPVARSTPISNRVSTPKNRHPSPHHVRDNVEQRLTPERVPVKEEPEELYAVSIHENQSDNRKRGFVSDDNGDVQITEGSNQPPKQSRLENIPENESLMSIIGYSETDDTLDVSQDQEESITREIDYLIAQNVTEKAKQDAEKMAADAASSYQSYPSTSAAAQGANNNDVNLVSYSTAALGKNPEANIGQVMDRSVRCRVKLFQRWIQNGPYFDFRPIEDIPPEELDTYLAEFFPNIKTKSGDDFTHRSLCRLRSSLEWYLKQQNYPFSITCSAEFNKSRQCYHEKRKCLMKNEKVTRLCSLKKQDDFLAMSLKTIKDETIL